MAMHAALGTWQHRIHRYIGLTEFAAEKLVRTRVPVERLRIKPNFTCDRGEGTGDGGFGLFAGRLTPEKGIYTLLAADKARLLAMPVHIAGDGPLREEVERAARQPGSQLTFLGSLSSSELLLVMKSATALVVPSLWYEGFPMVVVEAFSLGLPIVGSRLGSLQEVVEDGVVGMLHEPGDAASLGNAIDRFTAMSASEKQAMRSRCRKRFIDRYTEDRNYDLLIAIYSEAILLAQTESAPGMNMSGRRPERR
jgi:glycosyltransferase involved in cell wall biosynthesis